MSGTRPERQPNHAVILKKMLALESRKGFRDTSVSGGFERYFAHLSQGPNDGTHPQPVVANVSKLFRGYSSLDPARRQERVRQALSLLESEQPAARTSTRSDTEPRTRQNAIFSKPKRTVRRTSSTPTISSLDDPVTVLPRVGEGRKRQLAALGVATVGDLLQLLPRQHKDYSKVQSISSMLFHRECTIRGEVVSIQEQRTKTGRPIVSVEIDD